MRNGYIPAPKDLSNLRQYLRFMAPSALSAGIVSLQNASNASAVILYLADISAKRVTSLSGMANRTQLELYHTTKIPVRIAHDHLSVITFLQANKMFIFCVFNSPLEIGQWHFSLTVYNLK